MANVLDIRRRIRSVKSTRQITGAMKMVSAAKLRRAQERALAARPYSQMLTNVLKSLVQRAEIYDPETGEAKHPLLVHREERNIVVIVVTADRGLAGAFNSNIIRSLQKFLEKEQDRNIDLEFIGRKGRDFFRRRYPVADPHAPRVAPIQITGDHAGIIAKPTFEAVQQIAESIIERYKRGTIDAVYLVFNEFKSVIAQRLVVEAVLPVQNIGERAIEQADELSKQERENLAEAASAAGLTLEEQDTTEIDRRAAEFGSAQTDYIYEQPADELFASLLPRYIAVELFKSVLESVAAEHAARMTAMDSATNNASDMIDSLTLTMNRVRQAAITKEIIEIVSGASAL